MQGAQRRAMRGPFHIAPAAAVLAVPPITETTVFDFLCGSAALRDSWFSSMVKTDNLSQRRRDTKKIVRHFHGAFSRSTGGRQALGGSSAFISVHMGQFCFSRFGAGLRQTEYWPQINADKRRLTQSVPIRAMPENLLALSALFRKITVCRTTRIFPNSMGWWGRRPPSAHDPPVALLRSSLEADAQYVFS
jgi:hypothetical protein